MEIHFCDLCNESVPQIDLDEGRAFLRKGRVVCSTCDRTMSQPGAPGGGPAGPFGGGGSGGGHGLGGSMATAAAPAGVLAGSGAPGHGSPHGSPPHGSPYGAPQAGPALGGPAPAPSGPGSVYGPPAQAHYGPPANPRAARGSGPALGVAMLAVLLCGAVGFFAWDLSERQRGLDLDMGADLRMIRQDQDAAGSRIDAALRTLAEERATFEERLMARLGEQGDSVDGRLQEVGAQARAVDERLAEFGREIASIRETFGEVRRHDQELVLLQQKYTGLVGDVRALVTALEELSARGLAAPGAGPGGPGASLEAAPPAWIGLTEQLGSNNPSDRWQAVVALGETRDPAVTSYLLPSLEDNDIFIRMVAARVLGDLGSHLSVGPLIESLDDEEGAVREAAYIALRTITKRDLPFDPVTEDSSERSRRIKAWRDWWNKEKGKYEGA